MNEKESPPAKNYAGVDMVTYFAQMLFDETLGSFQVKYREKTDGTNLFSQAQQILDARDKIVSELKEKGSYFYPSGGSVFMDYKIALQWAFPEDGALSNWKQSNIRLDMSSQEAFEMCKQLVEKWWK